jgi:hypothetical protein
MEILGTNFSITIGSWKLRFCLAIEDTDMPVPAPVRAPHHVRYTTNPLGTAERT